MNFASSDWPIRSIGDYNYNVIEAIVSPQYLIDTPFFCDIGDGL